MAEKQKYNIGKVDEVKIKYSDVFDIKIPADTELGKKTREFMEFFEQAKFRYYGTDPATGQQVIKETTGQDMLQEAKTKADRMHKLLEDINSPAKNIIVPNGKIPIIQTPGTFDGHKETGCSTCFGVVPVGQGLGVTAPVHIQLSEDYLKRSNYHSTDGKIYPVTIDAVMANELQEACAFKASDSASIYFENIVLGNMGSPQRTNQEKLAQPDAVQRSSIGTLYDNMLLVPSQPQIAPKQPENSKPDPAAKPQEETKEIKQQQVGQTEKSLGPVNPTALLRQKEQALFI